MNHSPQDIRVAESRPARWRRYGRITAWTALAVIVAALATARRWTRAQPPDGLLLTLLRIARSSPLRHCMWEGVTGVVDDAGHRSVVQVEDYQVTNQC